MVFKCKMCGGSLDISEGISVCECEYCGTKQTLPNLDNEKLNQLFDRANYYRMNNEFDKAMMVYEDILSEVPDEAEAHWGICLCRYGIEYVEDPKSKKRIPTCHRTQFKSIMDDKNYHSAISKSDPIAQEVYKSEAKYIDTVQKKILEISNKEEPFDIFICYKESDDAGDRTIDSSIAEDIYTYLNENGYKVFFARITLEDKLGSAYEPYIFAALNSSKIMLIVGTKPEYFNAVWVKNEWARYLAMIEDGQKKFIIPCYRDMSPYDMPKEFTALQSQDISKVGYMQDLLRGISKLIAPTNNMQQQSEIVTVAPKIDNILKRVSIALESGEYADASRLVDTALNYDTENGRAYYLQLMAQCHAKDEESLMATNEFIENKPAFKRAMKYGDDNQKKKLEEISKINKMHVHYITAKNDFANGRIVEAKEVFEELGDYADSSDYLEKCHNVIKLSNTIQEYRREVGDGSDYIPNRIMQDNPMQYSNFMNMLENVSKQANGRNKYGETGKTFFVVGILVIFGFLLGLIPFSITENWGDFICILTSAIFIPVKFIDGILKKIGIGIGIFMGSAILLELTQIFTLLFLIAGVISVGAGIFYYHNGGCYEIALTKARSYYNNVIQPLEDSIRSDVNKRYPIDREFQVHLQGILKTNL